MSTTNQSISGNNNNLAGRDVNINNNFIDNIQKKSAIIAKVIAMLSSKMVNNVLETIDASVTPAIEEKIEYNNLVKYKPFIEKYVSYGGIIESICNGLDVDKPNSKTRMFEYIHSLYLLERGELYLKNAESVDVVKNNSDYIIDHIYLKLRSSLNECLGLDGIEEEDIHLGVTVLIVLAFIECKILERPI